MQSKTYGRSELAQLYFPKFTQKSAWQKLRGWIVINPRLHALIDSGRRTFSPQEVSIIFEELGEPG